MKLWPQQTRPREKLLKMGVAFMDDAEILSILLRTGSPGENSLELARRLLNHFGSISAILHSKLEDFAHFNGIGLSKWAQLKASYELAKRCNLEQLKISNLMNSIDTVKEYVFNCIAHKEHEVFMCLYLNAQNSLIHSEELFRGSIHEAPIYIREIMKGCLRHNASYLIVAHNHPSGCLSPSSTDLELTQTLANALKLIEVQLLDHCITSKEGSISLLESELM